MVLKARSYDFAAFIIWLVGNKCKAIYYADGGLGPKFS